ncbi:MAG: hypothetical protein ACI4DP_00660, partial [Candidatus Ornithomonoglobus sp.]
TRICDFQKDTEHHIELVIDYDIELYSVQIDSNDAKTISFADAGYNAAASGAMRLFRLHSWAEDIMYYQLDNLIIYHK